MNTKALIGTIIETIIKIGVLVIAITFVFKFATKAYDFGYRVFADEPMSATGGRTITVGIEEGQDIKEIAKMLEEKGLIEDANLFVVQELLSAQHDKILPGIYDLSTDMKAAQMLEIMSTKPEDILPNRELAGEEGTPEQGDMMSEEGMMSEDGSLPEDGEAADEEPIPDDGTIEDVTE